MIVKAYLIGRMGRILEDISQWPIEKRRAKLEEVYQERIGVPLDLDNPQRFTEKTQWRKLYDDDPRITRCINKLTFKQYIREKIGEGYTVPLIDVWHNTTDVDFSSIPDKCVIKSNCSGDGHYILLIHEKNRIDIENQGKEIRETWFDRRYLNTNSFFCAYYPIKPCVIVEDLISDIETGVDEYKFLCFNGDPKYVYHGDDHFIRGEGNRRECSVSHYTLDWKNIGIQYGSHENKTNARPPKFMNEMIDISKKLSKDFSFVRVDFFENEKRFYVSEMTFTQGSGLTPYYPESFDYELGKLWRINA